MIEHLTLIYSDDLKSQILMVIYLALMIWARLTSHHLSILKLALTIQSFQILSYYPDRRIQSLRVLSQHPNL